MDSDMEMEVTRFKIELLRKMPFYGDIVMRLPFLPNTHIPTAQTDGTKIEYNPNFFTKMGQGERNFILMHEVFHVLLFHCKRHGERRPQVWNTAADMVVNDILGKLIPDMRRAGILFDYPKNGIFANVDVGVTVEDLYEQLLHDNPDLPGNAKTISIRRFGWYSASTQQVKTPDDVILPDPDKAPSVDGAVAADKASTKPQGLGEEMLRRFIRESAAANRSNIGSYYVPDALFALTESKKLPWHKLLRNFLQEERSDETAYATPERKYIHMDLILPGHGSDDERLEEVWAFVDSSGSIGKNEMEQFLTQMYRIAKEFKCLFHICYWDTQVTDVYRNIRKEDDILKSLPHHAGGTDINCVYRWIRENHVRPTVMLILTDGCFGSLRSGNHVPSLRKKTILVLSGMVRISDDMRRIGTIARLD